MKRFFVEKVHALNLNYVEVKNIDEELACDKQKADLKGEIAIAAFNGDLTYDEAVGLFSLIKF